MTGEPLSLPGVRLYHEVRGDGPVLLLIPGGNGDAATFGRLVPALADQYTVVSYDRRGYSRSVTDQPTPRTGWLARDVDDALALLDTYSPGVPALVFGSSSGAIVGLDLLARHPQRVRLLVAHEPPLLGILPDAADHRAFVDAIFDTAVREGADTAIRRFNRHIGIDGGEPPEPDRLPRAMAALFARITANHEPFLRYELRQYTAAVPDFDALARSRDRLILAGGRDSRHLLPYQPNLVLAQRLGLAVLDLPGGHIGYLTEPDGFAAALDSALNLAVTG